MFNIRNKNKAYIPHMDFQNGEQMSLNIVAEKVNNEYLRTKKIDIYSGKKIYKL